MKKILFAFIGYLLVTGGFVSSGLQAHAQDAPWPETPVFAPFSKNVKRNSSLAFKPRISGWPSIFQQDDAFKLLNTIPGRTGSFVLLSGVADRSQTPPERLNLINIKRLAPRSRGENQMSYPVSASTYLHSPQLARNGKLMLVRIGSAPIERFGAIGLLLWNLEKNQYRYIDAAGAVPHIYYPSIQFSPGSRFISYLKDGNAFGDYDQWTKPYRLYVCDLTTGQERFIDIGVGLDWSWTYRGTVLFSRISEKQVGAVARREVRPTIYEAGTTEKSPHRIISGGYFAQESPDGRWVAFCDWPGHLLEDEEASGGIRQRIKKGLFFFDRATKKRFFVGPLALEAGLSPSLQWSVDSKNLYVIDPQTSGKDRIGKLYRMSVETRTIQRLGTLTLENAQMNRSGGIFSFRDITADGKYLYIDAVKGIAGPEGHGNTLRTLIAVNTHSGEQVPIAHLENRANANPNWDWLDETNVAAARIGAENLEKALPAIKRK